MATLQTHTHMHLLSFDRHLRHAFQPLSARFVEGVKSVDGVIEMIKCRIEAEQKFTASLEKIILNYNNLIPCSTSLSLKDESLKIDGLDAIFADTKNEYTQHKEFLNSLNEDVYQPLNKMRDEYTNSNKIHAHNTRNITKQLKNSENHFIKIKLKYEKMLRESNSATQQLINAQNDIKISTTQIMKLSQKVNNTSKNELIWKDKYSKNQLLFNKQQNIFNNKMTNILKSMQINEELRMKTMKDSLNKWAVFITNLTANRNYDVKFLAESMATINIQNDMQLFMKNVLKKYPPKNKYNINNPYHNEKSTSKLVSNTNHVKSNSHFRGPSTSSVSSYIDNNQLRRSSASYSLSAYSDIRKELSRKHFRGSSTPTSISSYFKNKFIKQKSLTSLTKEDSNINLVLPPTDHNNNIIPPLPPPPPPVDNNSGYPDIFDNHGVVGDNSSRAMNRIFKLNNKNNKNNTNQLDPNDEDDDDDDVKNDNDNNGILTPSVSSVHTMTPPLNTSSLKIDLAPRSMSMSKSIKKVIGRTKTPILPTPPIKKQNK